MSSHFDALFGGPDEFGNENDGEILSDVENPDNDNAAAADGEAAGDGDAKAVKVEPKKRTVRHPRHILNVQRLCGPRGVTDLENYYKGMKFQGKGHERDDLDAVMKRMQHWAHRMFPKYGLDDSLAAIEHLGRKKQMQSYMNKYRMGMLEPELTEGAGDDGDKDEEDGGLEYETNVLNQPLDPLDSMLEEQIAISRAGDLNTSGIGNLSMASDRNFDSLRNESVSAAAAPPAPPSGPSTSSSPGLSEEMRAKIAANRLKAMELRKARMAAVEAAAAAQESTEQDTDGTAENDKAEESL